MPARARRAPEHPARLAVATLLAALHATPGGRAYLTRALARAGGGGAVYRALSCWVLRVRFVLCAEALGLLPARDPAYAERFSPRALLAPGAPACAWSRLRALFRALHAGHRDDALRLPARGGDLFDPALHPLLDAPGAPEPDDAGTARALALLAGEPPDEPESLGDAYEALLGFTVARVPGGPGGGVAVVPDGSRRASGSHYTPRALAREMVRRALGPLGREVGSPLRVCDPAMGCGAFLLAAGRELSGGVRGAGLAVRECLYGVDSDPLAVAAARHALWLLAGDPALPFTFLDERLLCGDATVGELPGGAGGKTPAGTRPLHWPRAFPEVFARGGFDAAVGNPPWVSYAGRAAQPIAPALREYYARHSPAFGRYRNLQGVFAHRAALLLRPGGRLALLLPSSMAFQDGYGPTRAAHDALCVPDDPLPFFGEDSFAGVFQPCMGLISTRSAPGDPPPGVELARRWPLEDRPAGEGESALLARLDALPRLPAHLFGERGFQTGRDDVSRLRPYASGEACGLRCGTDVQPFRAAAPSYACDPRDFGSRFRAVEEWRAVRLLLRQTARWPVAALGDGIPFRNSVLAGFADETYDPYFLLAYLNANPVRLYHYLRQRDARQGMPQLKVGHLRALPAPPGDETARARVREIGERFGARNAGISAAEQAELDERVAELLGLGRAEREAVRGFREGRAGDQKSVGSPALAQSAVPAR